MHATALLRELKKLKDSPHSDKQLLSTFIQRLATDTKIVRDLGTTDHFCVFCVPINTKKKQIYMGHHIKANSWIPPAGHIDLNESPRNAAKREFMEELRYTLTSEPIELFDVTSIILEKPRPTCTVHNDLWYLVHTKIQPFVFDTREFYEAGWYDIDEAIYKVTRKEYNMIIKKIRNRMYA